MIDEKTGILLLSHGSRLDDGEEVIKAYTDMYREEFPNVAVEYGFMEIRKPGIPETINKLTKEYNKLIEQYNASTNKDTKTKINEKIEAKSKEIQKAEDARKDLENKIKNYDDLRETMEDLIDEIEDETQQQIEIAITKFRM